MFDSIHWHVYGFKGIVDEITGFGVIGNILEDMALTPENVKTAAMIAYAVLVILAYFIGNISPSTILAKRQGLDIKKEGSGNAGTTNALRVMGKKAGIITLVIDIMKGVLAVVLAEIIAGEAAGMYCAVAVIVGHVWPVIYKFKGGKGVATTFGALVAINPLLGLWTLAVVALVTFLSKRMSAGSIAGAIAFPVICLFNEPEFIVWGTILAVIVLVKHRANIVRLLEGEEPKLGFLDKDKKTDADEVPAAEAADGAEQPEETETVSGQPEAAEKPVADEDSAEEISADDEEQPEEEQVAAEEDTSDEEPKEEPEAEQEQEEKTEVETEEQTPAKPEKYKRPAVDKTVKKNGKKKKSYPNKHKNSNSNAKNKGGKGKGKNSKSKNGGKKGNSKKKGGKKK